MSIAKNEIVVELNDVNKWYGEFHVLKNVCLRVAKGEKIVVFVVMSAWCSSTLTCSRI